MIDTLASRRDLILVQHQGARPYQEDSAGCLDQERPACIVLCDGMGGHEGGDVASALAVEHFLATWTETAKAPTPIDRLVAALEAGNDAIRTAIEDDHAPEGMGSTLVGLVIEDDQLWSVSVGDSPLWVVRDGELARINADHSMAPVIQAQLERGELTPEQAAKDPRRNQLRSALTGQDIELIDAPREPTLLETGDVVLVASDGIETLSEAEIEAVFSNAPDLDLPDLAEALLNAVLSKQKRSQDNVTIGLYRVGELPLEGKVDAASTKTAPPPSSSRFLALGILAIVLGVLIASAIYFAPQLSGQVTQLLSQPQSESGDNPVQGEMAPDGEPAEVADPAAPDGAQSEDLDTPDAPEEADVPEEAEEPSEDPPAPEDDG